MPEQLKLYALPLLALIGLGLWFVLRPPVDAEPTGDGQADGAGTRQAAIVDPVVKDLDPKVDGGVSKPGVIRFVQAEMHNLEDCYAKALRRSPGAAGRLILTIMIDSTGKVAAVHTTASQVGDDEVDQCFARILSTIQFPTPVRGAPTTVVFPFDLSAEVKASVDVADPPTG